MVAAQYHRAMGEVEARSKSGEHTDALLSSDVPVWALSGVRPERQGSPMDGRGGGLLIDHIAPVYLFSTPQLPLTERKVDGGLPWHKLLSPYYRSVRGSSNHKGGDTQGKSAF